MRAAQRAKKAVTQEKGPVATEDRRQRSFESHTMRDVMVIQLNPPLTSPAGFLARPSVHADAPLHYVPSRPLLHQAGDGQWHGPR